MTPTELKLWVNRWLGNVYGLGDDDLLNAGQVEELVEMALYDLLNEIKKGLHKID